MKNLEGKNIKLFLISLIIIAAIIGVSVYFVVFRDGNVMNVVNVELEYNNEEVVEELNLAIRKEYIEIYTKATENKIAVDSIYTSDLVLSNFVDKDIIEKYVEYDEENDTSKEIDNKFYVVVNNLKMDITAGKGENGSGKDIFTIEKNMETGVHEVMYYNSKQEATKIGELNFTPEV